MKIRLFLVFAPVLGLAGDLVPESSTLEKLATGFVTAEGPLVDAKGGFLWTDIPNEHIWRMDIASGAKTRFRENTDGANGLAFDAKGRLLMCKGKGRRLDRLEADGSETALLEPVRKLDNGKTRPVGVNDVIVGRNGRIYCTVPGGGAVYTLDPDGANPRVLVDGLNGPNGLTLSPDEKRLYVSEYKEQALWLFDLDPQTGKALNRRPFAKVEEPSDYGCDGMTVEIACL